MVYCITSIDYDGYDKECVLGVVKNVLPISKVVVVCRVNECVMGMINECIHLSKAVVGVASKRVCYVFRMEEGSLDDRVEKNILAGMIHEAKTMHRNAFTLIW